MIEVGVLLAIALAFLAMAAIFRLEIAIARLSKMREAKMDKPMMAYVHCPKCHALDGHAVIGGDVNGDPHSADVSAQCVRCGWPFDVRLTLLGDGETTAVEYPT